MDNKIRYGLLLMLLVIVAGLAISVREIFPSAPKQNNNSRLYLTPTPKISPFLNANNLNLPSSYMGYTFTKLSYADTTLGNNAVNYAGKSISIKGTEWLITKSNVSDTEFGQFKTDFLNFTKVQLSKLGWKSKINENGKELTTTSINTSLGSTTGYIKTAEGRFQVILIQADKNKQTCPCNVEFRVFLSSVENLN